MEGKENRNETTTSSSEIDTNCYGTAAAFFTQSIVFSKLELR